MRVNPIIARLMIQLMRQDSTLLRVEARKEAERLYSKGITDLFAE